jgi:LysR family transcriptional regulator, hca operon transcriptional activator
MELRHLRYFVAVAEEGSVTLAAQRRLHTAQPSLSRQIRELEREVGTQLLVRSTQGVELTPAGTAFLNHARLALAQVEAATSAALRASQPEQRTLALGFLSGWEPEWLPAVMHVLRDELPKIEVTIFTKHSPQLAEGLATGKLDAAFMRAEEGHPDLVYKVLTTEPLMVFLPSDHPLASREAIQPSDFVGQTFIGLADQAPVVRNLVEHYLRQRGTDLQPAHRAEYISMLISLVASTGGLAVAPENTRNFLTRSVVSRPFAEEVPSVDLVLGYHRANTSPVLELFLSNVDELAAYVSRRFGAADELNRH